MASSSRREKGGCRTWPKQSPASPSGEVGGATQKAETSFARWGRWDDSPDVICLRLVERKTTYVHRRLWPALVRLAAEFGKERLTAIRQEHTKTGAHRNVLTPFPKWVPAEIKAAAGKLSEADAREQLGPWASGG
jgi:hypothetical protein